MGVLECLCSIPTMVRSVWSCFQCCAIAYLCNSIKNCCTSTGKKISDCFSSTKNKVKSCCDKSNDEEIITIEPVATKNTVMHTEENPFEHEGKQDVTMIGAPTVQSDDW